MTRRELLALPATVDLPTGGRALGIGRTASYDLAARGEFPVRVLRLGRSYRVPTAELLALLGIERPASEASVPSECCGSGTSPAPPRPRSASLLGIEHPDRDGPSAA